MCTNLKCTCTFVSFIQLKFSVYGHTQTYIHTHASCNAIPLVWGSLNTYTCVLQCNLASVGLAQYIHTHASCNAISLVWGSLNTYTCVLQCNLASVGLAQYIHTHASCNAVSLVWGSLRLTPIIHTSMYTSTWLIYTYNNLSMF